MKLKKVLLIIMCVAVFITGCTQKESEPDDGNASVKNESITGECGYILANNIFDYRGYFETTYEWMNGVDMPIEKPDNANVEFKGREH